MQTWRVVKGEWVGNPEAGFRCEYYSGDDYPTKREAIRGGWDIYGHDDWLLLRLYDGKADRLFWMADERDDFEELQDVAKALGIGLTHVAEALGQEPLIVRWSGESVDMVAVRERVEARRKKLTIGDHALFHLLMDEVDRLRATVERIAEAGRDDLNTRMAEMTMQGVSFPGASPAWRSGVRRTRED